MIQEEEKTTGIELEQNSVLRKGERKRKEDSGGTEYSIIVQ